MSYCQWFEKNEKQIWKDFFSYLSIPSISADKEYFDDLLKAADFVKNRLHSMDFTVRMFDEGYAPIVYGEKIFDESYPTILIYGHYDVQPTDPNELWETPGFSPEVRDGRIYARGAEDNKGQNFYSMLAVQAFLEKHKDPKVNIKILIEGEEEVGSESFEKVASLHQEELKADYVWIVDMGIDSYEHPVISLGVRGIAAMEFTVSNSGFDLHSGSYGGCVYNPIRAISEIVASFHDKEGNIAVENFYKGAKELSPDIKNQLSLDTAKEVYEKETGSGCFQPKPGYSLGESIGICPTIELNGIYGGYSGEGSKTIIPKEASAKITCRLIDGQDPHAIVEIVKAHIQKHLPQGMKVDFSYGHGGKNAWTSPNCFSAKTFSSIVEEITGKPCGFVYSGGSIPLTAILAEVSGGEYIFLGTALPEDRIHAPNESFGLKQFKDGYMMIAKGLEVFAQNKKQC